MDEGQHQRQAVRYRAGVRRPPIEERIETHSDREDGGPKVLVRAWVCSKCSYANWPCRTTCRICQSRRSYAERRRDDWWVRDLLPEGAECEAHADRPARQSSPPPHRRVPGLQPPADRARPQPARPAARPLPVPPVVHPPPQRDQPRRGDDRGDRDDADEDSDGGERTWATVVGAGARRRIRKQRRGAQAQEETVAEAAGPAPAHADAARGLREARLPPPVEWDVPPVPLRWIRQMHADVAAKVDAAKESGDGVGLKKAEKERKRYGGWLKQAGGMGEAGLEFGVKSVKTRLAKAERAVQKVQDDIRQREASIEQIQQEIVDLRPQGLRHQARVDKFRDKVAYLSAQLHAETIPTSRERELQECRARMVEIGDPCFKVALDMLATMLPPSSGAQSFDIALDDSSGTDADDYPTDLDADDDGEGCRDDRGDDGGGDLCEGELRRHLEEASGTLQLILRGRDQAMANAKAALRRKRSSDGEEKVNDADGDECMLPVLSVEQVEASFAPRLAEAQARVDHLRWLLTQSMSSVAASTAGRAPPSCSPPQEPASSHLQPQQQQSEPQEQRHQDDAQPQIRQPRRPRSTSCDGAMRGKGAAVPPPLSVRSVAKDFEGRTITAEQRDSQRAARQIEQKIADDMSRLAADADELQRVVRVNAIIMQQNREQRELEAEVEAESEERGVQEGDRGVRQRRSSAGCDRDAPLLVFGPTGASLEEQQRAMRMAGSDNANPPQACNPVAPPPPRGRTTRWDKDDADESRQRSKTPRAARRPSGSRTTMAD